MSHILITGAAGFIGSHLTDRFLSRGDRVFGIDSLVRGRRENLADAFRNPLFTFFQTDLANEKNTHDAFRRANDIDRVAEVWHLAANSDIGAGTADPRVDLRDTFLTTFHTLLAMREQKITRLAFASSSAIYGAHAGSIDENAGPSLPISNYGAMKLGSEGLISAAAESYLDRAWIFRFPNVIGSRATHGVIYDLAHKLRHSKASLEVLGDGRQQKPYLHVTELIEAMIFIAGNATDKLNFYNIAGIGEGATVSLIAETVVRMVAPGTPIRYSGGTQGWVGDVPNYRYSTEKLERLGWHPSLTSEEAVERAAREICREICRP